MNKIKGILFDKDGTLIDFHSIWIPTVHKLVDELVSHVGESENLLLKTDLLAAIGVEDDRVKAKGILASGTTSDIADDFQKVFQIHGIQLNLGKSLYDWTVETLLFLTKQHVEYIRPTANLTLLFNELVNKGFILGVATADDYDSTKICLEKLKVDQFISFIGTSDRFEKKPNPAMIYAFCDKFGFKPEEVVVVGDTIVDLMFAQNGEVALAIGVLTGVSERNDLEPFANITLSSVNELLLEGGKFVWETLESKTTS